MNHSASLLYYQNGTLPPVAFAASPSPPLHRAKPVSASFGGADVNILKGFSRLTMAYFDLF